MWAAYDSDKQVIYADHQTQIWQHTASKNQQLELLSSQLFGDYMVVKEGLLYGINSQAELWRFNLATAEFTTITALDKDITYVSDIKGQQVLATKFIGGRRELMEFSQH